MALLGFFPPGEYAGFDETQPTAESGGKGRVISMLKKEHGFEKVVMIGDGATDLEACPPAVSKHYTALHLAEAFIQRDVQTRA